MDYVFVCKAYKKNNDNVMLLSIAMQQNARLLFSDTASILYLLARKSNDLARNRRQMFQIFRRKFVPVWLLKLNFNQ
jgi:hypothetical protein